MMDGSERTGPDDAPCAERDDSLIQRVVGMITVTVQAAPKDQSMVLRTMCGKLGDATEDAFCLYGYISILACMLRMCNILRSEDSDEDWADLTGGMAGICQIAYHGVQSALSNYGNLMEFLPDSGWPWTVRSLWHVVGEWRGLRWADDEEVASAVSAELVRQRARRRALALHSGGPLPQNDALRVFALGMHVGLLEAPLAAIRLVLHDGPPVLQVVAPAGGSGAFCKLSHSELCGPTDPAFADIVQRHITKWWPDSRMPGFNREAIDSLPQMRGDFQAAFSSTMREADLLLCTEPMAFCSFFEEADRPVIMYVGNSPLFYLLPHDFEGALQAARRLAVGPRNTLLGISPSLAVVLEHTVQGVEPVVDTPLGLHVGAALHGYSPTELELGTILLTKRVTDAFEPQCMIVRILRAALPEDSTTRLRFVDIGDPTVPLQMRSFGAWATFKAALMLPMDALQMVVYDLYAMAMPIFVPHPTRWLPPFVFRKSLAVALSEPVPSQPPPGAFPYRRPYGTATDLNDISPGHGWDSLRAWTLLTDFAQLPHLRHFLSFAELLEALSDESALQETSKAMAAEHGQMMVRAAVSWRGILGKAFQTGP